MESMKLFTDEDLMDEKAPVEQEAPSLEEQLARALESREMARMALKKANEHNAALKRRAEDCMEKLRQERALRAAAQHKKSAAVPVALFVGSAILACLVILATNSMLVAEKLGEPLSFFFFGCCAFFSGMVWDRSGATEKLKGGKKNGNVGLQSAGRC